jgi:hypothetical protein
MNKKEQAIHKVAIRLFENVGKLNYGTVSATLIVHEGRVVTMCHEIKETIREREEVQNGTVC